MNHLEMLHDYTTDELLQELLSRTTFVGLVIKSDVEAKGITRHRKFRCMVSKNISPENAKGLLVNAVDSVPKEFM